MVQRLGVNRIRGRRLGMTLGKEMQVDMRSSLMWCAIIVVPRVITKSIARNQMSVSFPKKNHT
jgi:hypothetical protein